MRGDTEPDAGGDGDSGGEGRDGSSTGDGDTDDPGTDAPVGPRAWGGVESRGAGELFWLRLPNDEDLSSMGDTESLGGTGLRRMLASWGSGATSCKHGGRTRLKYGWAGGSGHAQRRTDVCNSLLELLPVYRP